MPEFVKLKKELGDRVHVVAVSMDLIEPLGDPQNPASIGALAASRGFNGLDVVLFNGERDALVDGPWDLPGGLPFTLAFDGEGKELARHLGPSRVDQLRAMLGMPPAGG